MAGGAIGALIQGFRRAAFSNEAGIGSASIAHSAVRTKEPITEGLVALHEPFIDTVVICTMTALVIVITGVYYGRGGGMSGVELTSTAFGSAFSWFPYILAVAVILFAFSTMLSWSYYGAKCWTYLFGENRTMDLVFKVIFCIFVVIGASMNLGPGDRLLGLGDLRHGDRQHHRALHPVPGGEKGTGVLLGPAEERRDQEIRHRPRRHLSERNRQPLRWLPVYRGGFVSAGVTAPFAPTVEFPPAVG